MAVDDYLLKGVKVLVVDDIADNIFSLTALLEAYDMNVTAMTNGPDAIRLLQETPIEIILMDIRMPGMDGYEAIKIIRQDEKLADIPIIAVTAQAMRGDKEKCLDAGADDYISKPIDTDLLIEKISKLIK